MRGIEARAALCIESDELLDGRIKFIWGKNGERSIPPRKISASDSFCLPRIKVRQRVEPSTPIIPFLREPDLITAEEAIPSCITKECRIVRVENELGSAWIRLGALVEPNQLIDQCGVEARVELVCEKHRAPSEAV